MIHHLPETLRPQAIGEMLRVLRPGGSVLIAEFRPPSRRAPVAGSRAARTVARSASVTSIDRPNADGGRRRHGGFLGGEYGQTGEPDAFAARLRDVLTDDG